MVDSQHLSKLHDIHLPAPIGWWPLAPGWYILSGAILLITGIIITVVYRHYMHGLAKRQACKMLAEYEHEYDSEGNTAVTCAKISELLRRVALVYFPRQDVASLQGDDWISFLNTTSKGINFKAVRHCLLELPYQNQVQSTNLKPLFTRVHAWIKQRGIPCSN